MKQRGKIAALILLSVIGLGSALRHDLAAWARQRGDARLQSGDTGGAEAAYRQAGALGAADGPLAYNLGVGLYRAGDFVAAEQRFTAALAKSEPGLAAAARYNRGNCRFRLAQQTAASDRRAALAFLEAAIADYGQVLASSPDAADAAGNLALARTQLASLADAEDARQGKDVAEQTPAATGAGRSSVDTLRSKAQASATTPTAGVARDADKPDASAGAGKTRRDLSATEAERLLNEARGREKLAGALHAGKQNGRMPGPDRDW
jgi:hypothetical protein